METLKEILKNESINFRTITVKGQTPMLQIRRNDVSHWLRKIVKNQGFKIETIDSTALIYSK